MIWAVTGEGEFFNADHLLVLREEISDGQKSWYNLNDSKLKDFFADIDSSERCLLLRANNTVSWMNVNGNMVPGTVLAAT